MASKGGVTKNDHVVIVGAGYAGTALAAKLMSAKMNFTLIDGNDSFHHCVGSPRAIIEQGFASKLFIPYQVTFGSHFKKDIVTSIEPERYVVQLQSGEEINYDYLVIATGSNGNFPNKIGFEDKTSLVEKYAAFWERVKRAQTISVVGGGAVGVETAAEIATEYPYKEVTLIHGGSKLIHPNLGDKFLAKVKKILEEQRVRIITDEKVTNLEEVSEDGHGLLKTDKGSSVPADLVIVCTGISPNSAAYADSLSEAVDSQGALIVNKQFEVQGQSSVYSIGDCCAVGDPRLARLAEDHAKHVFDVIKKKMKGNKGKEYKPENMTKGGLIVVSLGRNHAVGQIANGFMLPEFLIKKIKCTDLLTAKTWGNFKQKMPKDPAK